MYSGKDVNDCKPEEKERCWQIKPATLATDDSNLNRKSFLRAFGKGRCKKNAKKDSIPEKYLIYKLPSSYLIHMN